MCIRDSDNIELCALVTPPLAFVEQPMEAMGEDAARLMLLRLEGSQEPAQLLRLKSKLVRPETVEV